MAISTRTTTLIPLDRIAWYLGINPFHFNSIVSEEYFPVDELSCDDVWFQYEYQRNGRLAREGLAAALKEAEEIVTTFLGWSPIPRWYTNEQVALPLHYNPLIYSHFNAHGRRKSVETQWGHVYEVGIKASTLLASPTTTPFDSNGDGYNDSMRITFAATEYDFDEIRVYFPNENAADNWEIRPLDSIAYTGGSYTIEFSKALVPLPDLWTVIRGPNHQTIRIDGDVPANFLTSVEVYRVYTDDSYSIVYESEPAIGSASMALTLTQAQTFIRDARLGHLAYDLPCTTNIRPTRARLYYRAGGVDLTKVFKTRQMHEDLERMIVFFALSKLDRELCGCCNTHNVWDYLTEDLSLSTPEKQHTLAWDTFKNPYGTTRAAIDLWQYTTPLRLGKSPYQR
jgi:hypothetical protein